MHKEGRLNNSLFSSSQPRYKVVEQRVVEMPRWLRLQPQLQLQPELEGASLLLGEERQILQLSRQGSILHQRPLQRRRESEDD